MSSPSLLLLFEASSSESAFLFPLPLPFPFPLPRFPFPLPFPLPFPFFCLSSFFAFFCLGRKIQKNMSARLLPESHPEKRNFHDLNQNQDTFVSSTFSAYHFLHCATSAAFSLPSFGFNDSNPCSSLGSRPFSN